MVLTESIARHLLPLDRCFGRCLDPLPDGSLPAFNVAGRFGIRPGELFRLNGTETCYVRAQRSNNPKSMFPGFRGNWYRWSPNGFHARQVAPARGPWASLSSGGNWTGLVVLRLGGIPAGRIILSRHLDSPFWGIEAPPFFLRKTQASQRHAPRQFQPSGFR